MSKTDMLLYLARIIGIMLLFALFPLTIQLVFYTLGKRIFRNTSAPKIYSVCLAVNALICGAVSAWLCFFEDYDNGLAYFVGWMFAAVCVVTLLIMLICNIRQYKKYREGI